jgi:nucleotide-binding universal stress UspA family protein
MVKKILTALDGSKTAESVLPYLETLLATEDANVTLVQVVPAGAPDRLDVAAAYLQKISASLRARGAVVDTAVETGAPAAELALKAARGGYSLLLMCSRGKSGLKRLFLGSVAEEVLRRSTIPVLIVHPLAKTAGMVRLKRIVVPLDGSVRSATILPHVATLAQATGARLLFMTTVSPEAKSDYPVEVVARNLFREQKRLHREGIPTELSIRYGEPVSEILSFSDVQGADLIALSTHGRSGVERAIYGSVTESVLRKGTLPLLILRTAGKFVYEPLSAPKVRAERRKKQLDQVGAFH